MREVAQGNSSYALPARCTLPRDGKGRVRARQHFGLRLHTVGSPGLVCFRVSLLVMMLAADGFIMGVRADAAMDARRRRTRRNGRPNARHKLR